VIPDPFPVEGQNGLLELRLVLQQHVCKDWGCAGFEIVNQSDGFDLDSSGLNPLLEFAVRAIVGNVHQEQLWRHTDPASLNYDTYGTLLAGVEPFLVHLSSNTGYPFEFLLAEEYLFQVPAAKPIALGTP